MIIDFSNNGGGGSGSGSNVSYTQIVSAGTALGTITIDGVGNSIYAPEVPDLTPYYTSAQTESAINDATSGISEHLAEVEEVTSRALNELNDSLSAYTTSGQVQTQINDSISGISVEQNYVIVDNLDRLNAPYEGQIATVKDTLHTFADLYYIVAYYNSVTFTNDGDEFLLAQIGDGGDVIDIKAKYRESDNTFSFYCGDDEIRDGFNYFYLYDVSLNNDLYRINYIGYASQAGGTWQLNVTIISDSSYMSANTEWQQSEIDTGQAGESVTIGNSGGTYIYKYVCTSPGEPPYIEPTYDWVWVDFAPEVTVDTAVSAGTEIATINIGSSATTIYAPPENEVQWNQINEYGTKIAEITIGSATTDVIVPGENIDWRLESLEWVTQDGQMVTAAALNDLNNRVSEAVTSSTITTIWKGSQQDYDSLAPDYDNNTLYIIV